MLPLIKIRRYLGSGSGYSNEQRIANAIYIFGLVMFVMGMARTYIWPQMYLTMGLCLAYRFILVTEINSLAN